MALNDKKISAFNLIDEAALLDIGAMVIEQAGLNYKLPIGTLKTVALNSLYSERPLGEMSLTATAAQTFTGGAYEQITAFNKIQYERNLSVDLTTDSITIEQDGNYQITTTINSEFATSQSVEYAVLIDGVVSEALGIINGGGSGKPVYLGGTDIDPLLIGQVVTLGAREFAGASVDVIFHKVRIIVARV